MKVFKFDIQRFAEVINLTSGNDNFTITGSNKIVYAQGDSMSPEINSGDALLVDTSQTNILDGVVYAFNYDGQPMCKRLQKIGKDIKAISSNPLFDSFIIDFTCQFNIVGRVVGFMRPVL